jgi:hypothetical protein
MHVTQFLLSKPIPKSHGRFMVEAILCARLVGVLSSTTQVWVHVELDLSLFFFDEKNFIPSRYSHFLVYDPKRYSQQFSLFIGPC